MHHYNVVVRVRQRGAIGVFYQQYFDVELKQKIDQNLKETDPMEYESQVSLAVRTEWYETYGELYEVHHFISITEKT